MTKHSRLGGRNSTISFWTKEGLLEILEIIDAGYYLYGLKMAELIKQIHKL